MAAEVLLDSDGYILLDADGNEQLAGTDASKCTCCKPQDLSTCDSSLSRCATATLKVNASVGPGCYGAGYSVGGGFFCLPIKVTASSFSGTFTLPNYLGYAPPGTEAVFSKTVPFEAGFVCLTSFISDLCDDCETTYPLDQAFISLVRTYDGLGFCTWSVHVEAQTSAVVLGIGSQVGVTLFNGSVSPPDKTVIGDVGANDTSSMAQSDCLLGSPERGGTATFKIHDTLDCSDGSGGGSSADSGESSGASSEESSGGSSEGSSGGSSEGSSAGSSGDSGIGGGPESLGSGSEECDCDSCDEATYTASLSGFSGSASFLNGQSIALDFVDICTWQGTGVVDITATCNAGRYTIIMTASGGGTTFVVTPGDLNFCPPGTYLVTADTGGDLDHGTLTIS